MLSLLTKTITDDELRFIASLDYDQGTDRHLVELRKVIFEQDGNFRDDQRWYPYEVVELGSHSLSCGHEREFFFCTMLVLQAVTNGFDRSFELSDKLRDRSGDYDLLPEELQEQVLGAYLLAERVSLPSSP